MSNVPLAREYLEGAKKWLFEGDTHRALNAIEKAMNCLYREPPVRKAPRQSVVAGPIANDIRMHAAFHPEKSMADIAHVFNVNPGRVSEILNERNK